MSKWSYSEDLLQFIWENQLFDQSGLKTDTHQSVTIIKQGFLNRGSGPDFQNAQIKIGNSMHYGSVEIHIESGDWQNHGHHKDAHYNNVILHVCYTRRGETQRADGTFIPTIELNTKINEKSLQKYNALMVNKPFVYCENLLQHLSDFDKVSWLERMVIERLETRCDLFNEYLTLSNQNWNQAFHVAILRSFGLPTNGDSFEELAVKLPIDLLIKHQQSIFQIEALLFGVAGLLREENKDKYYCDLQAEYRFLKEKYMLTEIHTPLKHGKIRPMNMPHVKLAQFAAFIHHVPHFTQAVLLLPTIEEIKKLLQFETSTYWKTHYSFRHASPSKDKNLSTQFISHLFLNAVVPFVFFYQKNKTNNNTDLALDYLEAIPAEKNNIITQWNKVGLNSKNAADTQALLHLYKNYCKLKKCLHCNLGKKIVLKNDAGFKK